MTIDFTQEQLQALMNYLATRPWAEVNAIMVPIIQQMQPANDAAPQAPALRAVEGG